MGTTTKMAIPYPEATGLVKDGWEDMKDIATQVDAKSGLVLLNKTDFSAVSSQSINNVFSSSYKTYQILIDYIPSTTGDLTFRFRVAGADNSTSNYDRQYVLGTGTSVSSARLTGGTSWGINGGAPSNRHFIKMVVVNPGHAINKGALTEVNFSYDSASGIAWTGNSYSFKATTIFDGFTLIASTGTVTGFVSVFGINE